MAVSKAGDTTTTSMARLIVAILYCCCCLISMTDGQSIILQTKCLLQLQRDFMHMTCRKDQTILVIKAVMGKTRPDTWRRDVCSNPQYEGSPEDCVHPLTDDWRSTCNQRINCSRSIAYSPMRQCGRRHDGGHVYISVTYRCIPNIYPTIQSCSGQQKSLADVGQLYITSQDYPRKWIKDECTCLIEMAPNHKARIQVFDFGHQSADAAGSPYCLHVGPPSSSMCAEREKTSFPAIEKSMDPYNNRFLLNIGRKAEGHPQIRTRYWLYITGIDMDHNTVGHINVTCGKETGALLPAGFSPTKSGPVMKAGDIPATPQPGSEDNNNDANLGYIIGGAAAGGALIVLLLIIIIVMLIKKRRSQKEAERDYRYAIRGTVATNSHTKPTIIHPGDAIRMPQEASTSRQLPAPPLASAPPPPYQSEAEYPYGGLADDHEYAYAELPTGYYTAMQTGKKDPSDKHPERNKYCELTVPSHNVPNNQPQQNGRVHTGLYYAVTPIVDPPKTMPKPPVLMPKGQRPKMPSDDSGVYIHGTGGNLFRDTEVEIVDNDLYHSIG